MLDSLRRVSDIRTRILWNLLRGTLLFLNGIALGGLLTSLSIRSWVLRHCCIDDRWNPAYWDLADDLLPYYVVFGLARLFLTFALLIAWFVGRRWSGPQSQVGR